MLAAANLPVMDDRNENGRRWLHDAWSKRISCHLCAAIFRDNADAEELRIHACNAPWKRLL